MNWLPESFEWPVGYANGVVFTDSGLAVVPQQPAGRVQIYDAEWEYVRGWHIGSGATGPFALKVTGDSVVEVLTVRGRLHKKFDLYGHLMSEETFPDPDGEPWFYHTYPDPGVSVFVPTPFWLMPFADPGIAWVVGVAGMVLAFGVLASGAKRKAGPESPCEGDPDSQ